MIELGSGTPHIWLTSAHVPEASELERLLAPEELERARRFVFLKDRRLFIIARAHLRRVLSQYAPISPEQWRFRTSPLGRPFIENRYEGPLLYFSLSHTNGMVSSLISLDEYAGIDAEDTERQSDCMAVARHAFSAAECRRLAPMPAKELRSKFYELWTLKEAYSKARSVGISIGFDRVEFEIRQAKIYASFQPSLNDNPDFWHFQLLRPTMRHQLAIAIRRGNGAMAQPVVRFFPL